MCRLILSHYPNTLAFCVIGSVADGTWENDSDVDLVWILRGRRRKQWQEELGYDYAGRVELVPLNIKELKRHHAQNSSLWHSIYSGLVIMDCTGLLEQLRRRPPALPSAEWKREWFEFFSHRLDWGIDHYRHILQFHKKYCDGDSCFCQVSEVLTRAVVNLARLLLIEHGLMPNSKAQMRAMIPAHFPSRRQQAALEVALRAHHEKRDLSLEEARELMNLGQYLRRRLERSLGQVKKFPPLRSAQIRK